MEASEKYELRECFRNFQLKREEWFKMSEDQRRKYVKDILMPCPLNSCIQRRRRMHLFMPKKATSVEKKMIISKNFL